MTYIQPLELQTWFVQVFAGNTDIFLSVALIAISAMCGYFRMSTMSMFFMISIFVAMFSGLISSSFLTLFSLIGGLLVGYWISKLVSR